MEESKTDDIQSMVNVVYESIKKDILDNKLKPGERLVEMKIADDFNVSRTPIREALRQLEEYGLIEYFPRKGSVVSSISTQNAIELYEIREYIEPLMVKDICTKSSRKKIEKLEDIVENMGNAAKAERYDDLRELLHHWNFSITEMLDNTYLKEVMEKLYERLLRLGRLSLSSDENKLIAYEETILLVDAISKRDIIKSQELIRLHVINAKNRFLYNINFAHEGED